MKTIMTKRELEIKAALNGGRASREKFINGMFKKWHKQAQQADLEDELEQEEVLCLAK